MSTSGTYLLEACRELVRLDGGGSTLGDVLGATYALKGVRALYPAAHAAWLYARVVPGQTRAVAGSEEFVVLTKATHRTGGFTVAGARAEPASYPAHAMHRPITRLLNPDGTVLWEAK